MGLGRAWTGACLSMLLAGCGPAGVNGGDTSDTGDGSDDQGADMGETSDTGETGEDECQLALRLDQCCNGPIPASPDEIASDDCLAPYPIDYDALPADLLAACVDAQPDACAVIDCDTAAAASELVELGASGVCQFVCPPEEMVGYVDPGCGGPGPVPACLPPPPPCADEFCSCEGETIWGCGYVGEPYEHIGACE